MVHTRARDYNQESKAVALQGYRLDQEGVSIFSQFVTGKIEKSKRNHPFAKALLSITRATLRQAKRITIAVSQMGSHSDQLPLFFNTLKNLPGFYQLIFTDNGLGKNNTALTVNNFLKDLGDRSLDSLSLANNLFAASAGVQLVYGDHKPQPSLLAQMPLARLHVRQLDLSVSHLSDDGLQAVCQAVTANQHIQEVNLNDSLGDAAFNFSTETLKKVGKMLRHLSRLEFQSNGVDATGFAAMLDEALVEDSSAQQQAQIQNKHLAIDDNPLADAGAQQLCQKLSPPAVSTSVLTISVRDCEFTTKGWKKLDALTQSNSTVTINPEPRQILSP